MVFYTWEKRYHLTRWIMSFLFFLLGDSKLLTYANLLYTHTTRLAAFSQLGDGFVFFCSMAQDQSGGGRGGHGAMIQKGLLYRTLLGVMGTFQIG